MKRLLIILLLIAAIAHHTTAVTHRALVIGLGKQADTSWGKIHGDLDVFYVVQMLNTTGFTDVRTLKNEQATKQGIVRAFIDLAGSCKKGDIVYVHYSGHGQLITDIDGDEILRTGSQHAQWDESWIPYDAYMTYCKEDRGEKHLTDDEVAFYMQAIRNKIGSKGRLTVAIDACHSGDATCGEEEECVRGVDLKFNIPRTTSDVQATAAQPENWQTISACKPYQLSTEMKTMNIGKLTYAICTMGRRTFSMTNAELQKTLNDFMELNKGRLPQNPVVSGTR